MIHLMMNDTRGALCSIRANKSMLRGYLVGYWACFRDAYHRLRMQHSTC